MVNNNESKCTRDCRQCSLCHQVYCAAQTSLNTWDAVIALSNKFDALVAEMKGSAEQSVVSPVAQEGVAAQKIDSPSKTRQKNNEQ